jgi:hypothetical protein
MQMEQTELLQLLVQHVMAPGGTPGDGSISLGGSAASLPPGGRRRATTAQFGAEHLQLPAGKKHHFFISHCQATGGDQANLLANNLEKRGCQVWYVKMSQPNYCSCAIAISLT